MRSSTSVNLGVRSLWVALVLHLSSRSVRPVSSVVISLVDHSDNAASLTSMGTMHLHWLHHHLVLGALSCSIVEWLRVLLMINCLNSTSCLRPSHQFLLIERAIEVLDHWTSLLQRASVISDLLFGAWSLSLVISISRVTSAAYTSLAATTTCVLPSWLTSTLSCLAVAGLGLVILGAHENRLLVDGGFIWSLLKHAVFVIRLSRNSWRLRCVSVLVLHILLMLLALSMLGEVPQWFHAETGTHDLLLVLHHVHLVALTLEMSWIFAIRNFILQKVFDDVPVLIIHDFLTSSVIVTWGTGISKLWFVLGVLVLLVRVDTAYVRLHLASISCVVLLDLNLTTDATTADDLSGSGTIR